MSEHNGRINWLYVLVLGLLTIGFIVAAHLNDRIDRLNARVEQLSSAEVKNAEAYADWCGGYVQVIDRSVEVLQCDR